MKKFLLLAAVFIFNISVVTLTAQNTVQKTDTLAWRLCAQAWTFHNFTFSEALDKMKDAGIKYVEMYPGQKIGGGIEGNTSYTMDKATRDKVLSLVQSKGLKLLNYGVINPKAKEAWDTIFDFASVMGICTIISEPDSAQLNYIEPLCKKYNISVALHNHPNPSRYWNPDYTMSQIANRSKYIGVCADLGHWVRSSLNPIESIKKCNGRIMDVHAKDLIPAAGAFAGYHDVPWGTGTSNFAGMMRELKNQGYNGTVTVEYEFNWDKSSPEVKASANYFYQLTYWLNQK
jgi:sugar phosphate isomerase/epimerase